MKLKLNIRKDSLIFSKGDGNITIPIGKTKKPDVSKQSSFKEWNQQNDSHKYMSDL
jgi:hypothetical protein